MDAGSSREDALTASLRAENRMLSSGSTAAAKSYVENMRLGEPIFSARPSRSPDMPSSATAHPTAVPTASQALNAVSQSGLTAGILSHSSPSKAEPESPASVAESLSSAQVTQVSSMGPSSSEQPTAATLETRKASQSPRLSARMEGGSTTSSLSENKLVNDAAQKVLEAARRQARAEQTKKGRSAPASPQRGPVGSSPSPQSAAPSSLPTSNPSPADDDDDNKSSELQQEESTSETARPAIQKRRKSLIGTIKAKGRKARSRKNSLTNASQSSAGAGGDGSEDGGNSGSTTPGGTTRRRRYVDTRDLDLLAYELAAEALASGVPSQPFARPSHSGSSTPRSLGRSNGIQYSNEARRRSFHSTGSGSESNFNLSQTSLSNMMMQPLTQMSPMSRSREASFSNASGSPAVQHHTPGSSQPGSPYFQARDIPSSYSAKANSMVPHDMLTGLNDSPYPALPRKPRDPLDGIDNLDPFGIPLIHESPFDATSAYANRTSVYHSPTQIAHSRNRIGSSGSSTNGPRRSVLQMTMHDPEAELQGLTKLPKSKRSTPFGSRASSRAVTPSSSHTNLRLAQAEKRSPDGVRESSEASSKDKQSVDAAASINSIQEPSPGPETTLSPSVHNHLGMKDDPVPGNGLSSKDMTPTFSSNTITVGSTDAATPTQEVSKAEALKTSERSLKGAESIPESAADAASVRRTANRQNKRLSGIFGFGKAKKQVDARESKPSSIAGGSIGAQSSSEAQVSTVSGRQATAPLTDMNFKGSAAMSSQANLAPSIAPSQSGSASGREANSEPSEALGLVTGPNPAASSVRSPPERESSLPAASADKGSALSAPVSDPAKAQSKTSVVSSSKSMSSSRANQDNATGASVSSAPGNRKNGGIRKLLRRLGSFGASTGPANSSEKATFARAVKNSSAKANFPDASTMPKPAHLPATTTAVEKTKEIESESKGGDPVPAQSAAASGADKSEKYHEEEQEASPPNAASLQHSITPDMLDQEASVTRNEDVNFEMINVEESQPVETSAHAADKKKVGQDDEQLAPINSQMAASGFGTRSAYVFSVPPSQEQLGLPKAGDVPSGKVEERSYRDQAESACSRRSDSRTPSSEDSALLSSGQSYASGPLGSALLVPGQGGIIDEVGEGLTPASSSKSLVATKVEQPDLMGQGAPIVADPI